MIRGHGQRLHPEPDVRGRGAARAPRRSTSATATRRASRTGRSSASRCAASPPSASPAPRLELMDELGRRPGADVPDAGQPARGAHARRPRADACRHPRPERVDVRGVDVQLRGPDLRDAGDHAPHRGEGDRGARVGGRARCQDGPDPAGPGARATAARGRSASPSSTRSGRPSSTPTSSSSMHSSDSGYSRYQSDWTGPSEMLPFRLDSFRMMTIGKPADGGHHGGALLPRRVRPVPRSPGRLHRERRRLGGAVPRPPRRTSTRRCRRPSTGTRSSSSSATSTSARSTRTTSRPHRRRSGSDHVLFGSDYPHPEGLAEPCSYVDHLPAGLSDEDVRKIMGGNLARIMKVDVPVGAAS